MMELPHETEGSAITQSFAVLVEAARKVLARCPWTTERTVERYAPELRSEADEVLLAISNGDHENLKEELGDLLWDVVMCALLAERSGYFAAHEVLDQVVAKMQRRKPFVFNGIEVTEKEAKRMWTAAKAREKQARRTGIGPNQAKARDGLITTGRVSQ